MERIEGEAIRLFCPELADVSVWREAFEGPEASGEVVGRDEVGEMASKLIVGFAIEAFDRGILDRSVHARAVFDVRHPRDAVALETTVKGRTA